MIRLLGPPTLAASPLGARGGATFSARGIPDEGRRGIGGHPCARKQHPALDTDVLRRRALRPNAARLRPVAFAA